jgi:hypothetical protein
MVSPMANAAANIGNFERTRIGVGLPDCRPMTRIRGGPHPLAEP